MKPRRIVIVGLGGVGGRLARDIAQYVNFSDHRLPIVLVDGDRYERHNAARQRVTRVGENKARGTANAISRQFRGLRVRAVDSYLAAESGEKDGVLATAVSEVIQDGDLVLGCVDNHATRLLVSQHCQTIPNVIYVDGGNELTDGSVLVYIREDGNDVTPPIEKFQPGIQTPQDRRPDDLSCEERAQAGETQLLVTNAMTAMVMFHISWCLLEREQGSFSHVAYFDIGDLSIGPKVVYRQMGE